MNFFQGQETLTTMEWVLRAVFAFFFLLIVAKLLGQRAISQLRLLDFVLQEELQSIDERLANIEEKRKKYFELYELDDFDRDLFSGRLSELDAEREQLLSRKSEIEFELNGDNFQTVSYELVHSLIERFEYLLQKSSYDQRKTLLHLIIQKITLNDKRQIENIELAYDETTEQHFLSLPLLPRTWRKGLSLLIGRPQS